MGHGYSILEMTKSYEERSKEFGNIANDIMVNNTSYYGVLNIAKNFDLLFGLYSDDKINAVCVAIYRSWPTTLTYSEKPILIYLSQALNMFPEIKKIKFKKDNWPSPYGKKKVVKNHKQETINQKK